MTIEQLATSWTAVSSAAPTSQNHTGFLELLQSTESFFETESLRLLHEGKSKQDESQAERAEEERKKRIQELRRLIGLLRPEAQAGDPMAQGQLALLMNELMNLLNAPAAVG